MRRRTLAELYSDVERILHDHRVPGLSLGVLSDGERVVLPFGVANAETGLPVTAETLFQIGSISKILTATAAMPMIEQEAVHLDRPIREALPAFRVADADATERITLRHLLTHTGGFDGNIYIDVGPGDDALERDVALLADSAQRAEPGTLWHYANGGFSVAGRLLELHHGLVFEEAMRRALLAPLGMACTCFDAQEAILHPVAAGHLVCDQGWKVTRPWAMPRQAGPAGGIAATAGDLLTFAAAQMQHEERLRAMAEPLVRADPNRMWGLGWSVRHMGSIPTCGHNGLTYGFTSQLTLIPELNAAVAVLVNRDEGVGAVHDIESLVLREVFGLEWWEPAEIALRNGDLSRFAGTYREGDAVYQVIASNDRLRVERPQAPSFDLVPVEGGGFRAAGSEFDRKYGDILPGPDGQPRLLRFIGVLAERE